MNNVQITARMQAEVTTFILHAITVLSARRRCARRKRNVNDVANTFNPISSAVFLFM